MTGIEKRELERQRYWQGQILRAADFNDLLAVEDQKRWWHNRALHDAYGVSTGLELLKSEGNPPNYRIGPGVAYDCFGREILLSESRPIPPIPQIAEQSEWTLLIALCGSGCASRPRLFWKQTRQVSLTDGVPVALRESGATEPRIVGRPRQRKWGRQKVDRGTTPPEHTDWFHDVNTARPIVICVTIDTAAAGFSCPPCYFASLEFALPSFLSDVSRLGFRLNVVIGHSQQEIDPRFRDLATRGGVQIEDVVNYFRRNIHVHWLGVEDPDSETRN
jgi:hypothetical protein